MHFGRIESLATQEAPLLSLASLVRSRSGDVKHLQMMNLHLNYPMSMYTLRKALNCLVENEYYLISTDRYYHVLGSGMMTEEMWKRWNLNFLMVDSLASPRYIGHSLQRGFNLLRFNATDTLKTTVPHLAMELDEGQTFALMELRKFAVTKHGLQLTRSGEPYFQHLFEVEKIAIRVARELRLPEKEISLIQQAAILHDSIEDTDADYEDVLAISNHRVAQMVALLSNDKRRAKKERDRLFLDQIKVAPLPVQVIKLADIYSNVSSIHRQATEEEEVNLAYLAKADLFLAALSAQLRSNAAFRECRMMIEEMMVAE